MFNAISQILSQPVISDPHSSVLFVSAARAILIGLTALAVFRLAQLLKTTPQYTEPQTWVEFFKTPWWRLPVTGTLVGLSGNSVMLGLQLIVGVTVGSSDNTLTVYLLLTYLFLSVAAWSIAVGAAQLKRYLIKPG